MNTNLNRFISNSLHYSMMTFVISSLKAVEEEDKMTPEQLAIKNVGKQVRRKYLICNCLD